MRALTRIRKLAAAVMLLLFVTTNAMAGLPSRPIDRPEGPPEPNPQEVGEPDGGHAIISAYVRQLIAAALAGNPTLSRVAWPLLRVAPRSPAELRTRIGRGWSR